MSLPQKPERVFNRVREWDGPTRFATSANPDVRLGIVSGRRRQGRTFLLAAVAEATGGFFHTATDGAEVEELARFGRALAARTGGGRFAFAHWEEALDQLFRIVPEGLIVLDEFPYLVSRRTSAVLCKYSKTPASSSANWTPSATGARTTGSANRSSPSTRP